MGLTARTPDSVCLHNKESSCPSPRACRVRHCSKNFPCTILFTHAECGYWDHHPHSADGAAADSKAHNQAVAEVAVQCCVGFKPLPWTASCARGFSVPYGCCFPLPLLLTSNYGSFQAKARTALSPHTYFLLLSALGYREEQVAAVKASLQVQVCVFLFKGGGKGEEAGPTRGTGFLRGFRFDWFGKSVCSALFFKNTKPRNEMGCPALEFLSTRNNYIVKKQFNAIFRICLYLKEIPLKKKYVFISYDSENVQITMNLVSVLVTRAKYQKWSK